MSSYGCSVLPGPHTFSHGAFMIWVAKAFRQACGREIGAGKGPIDMNLGEGWFPLETISDTGFQVLIRRHASNGEIAFRLVYREGSGWKGLVGGKLENNPSVSMILKRIARVAVEYMKTHIPGRKDGGTGVPLAGIGEGEMDMRSERSCAVEEILIAGRLEREVGPLFEFVEIIMEIEGGGI